MHRALRWAAGAMFLFGCALAAACSGGGTPEPVWMHLARAFEPPEGAPGHRSGAGSWRVQVGKLSADGIPVAAGSAALVRCDLPPAGVLRFFTLAKGERGAGRGAGAVRMSVEVDGVPVFAADQKRGEAYLAWQAVELPRGPRLAAGIRFRAEVRPRSPSSGCR